jgi:hypothetical protein
MSAPITVSRIVERLFSFPHDRYLYIGGFMRSVVWAAATIVLLEILVNYNKQKLRLLPWIVSLMATMVTLMTWGRGVLLTNSKADVWDSVLPTLMGITEFCLFAVLAPRLFGVVSPQVNNEQKARSDSQIEPWHYRWFFVLAIHAGLAFFLVLNRRCLTDQVNDFTPELQDLASKYMGWLKGDLIGAGISCLAFIGFGLITRHLMRLGQKFPDRKVYVRIFVILTILPILAYSKVIYDAEDQRQQTEEAVFRLYAPEATKSPQPVPTATRE